MSWDDLYEDDAYARFQMADVLKDMQEQVARYKAEVQRLQRVVHNLLNNGCHNDECCVCLGNLQPFDASYQPPMQLCTECYNVFHKDCVAEVVTCPLCRVRF